MLSVHLRVNLCMIMTTKLNIHMKSPEKAGIDGTVHHESI